MYYVLFLISKLSFITKWISFITHIKTNFELNIEMYIFPPFPPHFPASLFTQNSHKLAWNVSKSTLTQYFLKPCSSIKSPTLPLSSIPKH